MLNHRLALVAIVSLALAFPTYAADPMSPVGLWKTFTDDNQPSALIRVSESGGIVSGKVEKILEGDGTAKCSKCPSDDPRKDMPILGMTVLKDMKKDGDIYNGGTILKAGEGTVAKAEIRLIDGGKKLEMKGKVGIFSKTVNWVRVE